VNYVIIDIETTGGSPKTSKVTEIAIFKHNGIEVVDHYETLINPEIEIPEFICKLTGISNDMVQKSPKFYEIAKEIIEFTNDCVFVAHNVNFDYNVLRHEFRSLGYDYRRSHLCTVSASRKIIPGYDSYSLGKLSKQLGIEIQSRHRAGGDALATVKLFDILISKNQKQLESFILEDIDPNQLNPNLDLAAVDDIPDKTGVYRLYNEFNQLLYINKSKQLKSSIKQHLKINQLKGIQLKMFTDIARIEFDLTGSELIASILAFSQIKQFKPKFIEKKQFGLKYGIFDDLDKQGYLRVYIEDVTKSSFRPFIKFETKKQAQEYLQQQIYHYNLCQSKTIKDTTFFECIEAIGGRCKGACEGKELPTSYNKRVEHLIEESSFSNAVFVVFESGRKKGEKSFVLVQKGIVKGYGFVPYHFHFQPHEKWYKFLVKIDEDKDLTYLVQSHIKKNESVNLIQF